ncbi:MAG: DUF5777 family beta-barrel protein, partial [Bacteroidia bacterium]
MKKIAIIMALFMANNLFAQEDLLKMMEEETPTKPTPVFASFKSTRLVNLHTNEQMKAKHLDFRIQHRFQPMQIDKENVYGLYNMFGVDGAVMRLGFEYGVTDKLMMGFGRSNVGKTYDLMAKYKILQQTRGKKSMPISVNYFGNIGINTLEFADKTRNNFFTSRLSFVNQLIITRKFNDYVSVAITPTMVHQNLVETKAQSHDIYAVGLGASVKISRSTRFNFEYIPRLNARDEKKLDGTQYYDAFAFGLDIETGGHVFQLHFTNGA